MLIQASIKLYHTSFCSLLPLFHFTGSLSIFRMIRNACYKPGIISTSMAMATHTWTQTLRWFCYRRGHWTMYVYCVYGQIKFHCFSIMCVCSVLCGFVERKSSMEVLYDTPFSCHKNVICVACSINISPYYRKCVLVRCSRYFGFEISNSFSPSHCSPLLTPTYTITKPRTNASLLRNIPVSPR